MKKYLTALTEKLSVRSASLLVAVAVVVLSIPAAVLAWGPSRPTFTQENAAPYVTFNSITNNPTYGDERNFFRVRDVAANNTFNDDANLVPGKEYEALIFYHNNAKTQLNASGTGVAQGAFARAEMPAIVRAGSERAAANAYVGATNANPTTVFDYIDLKNATAGDIALRYVPGTAKIYSNGAVNGQSLSDSLFATTGVKLGYDSLNGTLPGCDEYSGIIKWRFVASQANFDFIKDVRLSGTKEWQDKVTVNPGAEVEYRLQYKNSGNTTQNNVVIKDKLPEGVSYLPGKTKLYNASNPNGKAIGDGINADGVNIGNYAPGANGIIVLSAKVTGTTCATLVNNGSVETNNGTKQDTATVVVPGENCAPAALPTTGPVEVIAGLVGIAAITVGIVYYMKSRKDLEDALHNAQTHPSMTKTETTKTDEHNM